MLKQSSILDDQAAGKDVGKEALKLDDNEELVAEDADEDDFAGVCNFPALCGGFEAQLDLFTNNACGQPEDLPEPVLNILEKVGVVETVEVPIVYDEKKEPENMELLKERGKQITAAEGRAGELNQGAQDYRTLASRLKGKTKQQHDQSKWRPFAKKGPPS